MPLNQRLDEPTEKPDRGRKLSKLGTDPFHRIRLDDAQPSREVRRVKTLTIEKFLHSPGLAQSLSPGQSLLITAKGKPELIVTKAGQRPKTTAVQMRREAKALLSKPGKKVDTVALLRELRK